ncbi:hypothetical protein FRC14_000080 [Serendipita sp. 396]|nr:hypothetical protein FRC14_000080 [Serendipita sp. 396]KAG8789839.1 hypothetical protein FRC15_000031 [Serendipita sp. 397]KAG8804820.1 hypothetical protein FRC16_000074 [Serendipita sp. 398]KAG8826307.1 hypothetical protein FRC19_009267 [Serendipita sp. 401]KAG8879489.1 hypothetical protein FRC20_000061 [Serendipita sp. 405]KAG9057046.1 hypothetical protein FS842_008708 [Serendipita sp. 407]
MASNTNSFDDVQASTTSNLPVRITNSISLVACVAVVVTYLLFRRKNPRIMERTSLVLALAMAISDGLLHLINLFGYSQLPHNAVCAFVGGFLYAFPTLVSILYSACIGLNTQLIFVFSKRPGTSIIKYYLGVPILFALLVCVPALATGTYGYDESWDLCWYSTENKTPRQVLIRYIFTFGFWCLFTIFYLVCAATTIIFALFSSRSKLNRLASNLSQSISTGQARSVPHKHASKETASSTAEDKRVSFLPEISATGTLFYPPQSPASVAMESASSQMPKKNETLSRRSLAMRALAVRLLGYITIPMICILPGVIKDLVSKIDPRAIDHLPSQVSTMFDTLNGFVGLFNAILFALDPALLALYHQILVERRERRNDQTTIPHSDQDLESGDVLSVPSTPGLEAPSQYRLDGTGKVEVRPGKYLTPIFIGDRWTKRKQPREGRGIIIRVDVEVNNDLERLGDYLGGL